MFTSKSSLNRLEDIQRRALRFVLCNYDSCYENLLKAASVPGIRINLMRCLAIKVFKCVNGLNPDYFNKMIHKNRVHTSYATHPFCPDLKLIILITVSKLSVAMEPKYGIHCPYHWNRACFFMNSNKWSNHGMVPVAAAPFVSYTHDLKTNTWPNNGVYMIVWCFVLTYRWAFMYVLFFFGYASLLCIYVYHFSSLVSFYAYIFLGVLMSDPEIFCICFMCIYWYM